MEFILENKWTFLITAEVIFWVSILSFLTLRYWFKLQKFSLVFFFIFIINDLWIATMGFMDYLKTGEFTSYQIVILIVIFYALTYGKSDFRRLDGFMQIKIAKLRKEPLPEIDQHKELYGMEYAKKEWKQVLGHILIFSIVHVALMLYFGLTTKLSDIKSVESLFKFWFSDTQSSFPFNNPGANNFSRIWTLVLLIDVVITLSYTLFPKSNRKAILEEK